MTCQQNSTALAKRPPLPVLPLCLPLTSTPVLSLQEFSLGSHSNILSGPVAPGTSDAWAWEDMGCLRNFSPKKELSRRAQGLHPRPQQIHCPIKVPSCVSENMTSRRDSFVSIWTPSLWQGPSKALSCCSAYTAELSSSCRHSCTQRQWEGTVGQGISDSLYMARCSI